MKKDEKKKEAGPDLGYSSGDSVYDNNRTECNTLQKLEKEEYLKELWRLCFLKSLGAS